MAFGFGVGDIILLTTTLVNTIEDIQDAPKELQDLAERVGLSEETLESIEEELSHHAVAGNIPNIVRRKKRVKEVLKRMHDIVIKYRDSAGWVTPLNRIIYSVWDKREIAELVAKLAERIDDLTTFLLMQTWRSTNQMRPLIDQILTISRQEKGPINDQDPSEGRSSTHEPGSYKGTNNQTTVSDQIDEVQAVLEHVMQTEPPSSANLQPDQEDVSVEQELRNQLGQAGIGAPFTKALIEVIHKQRGQLAHPEDIDPISYTGGKSRLEVPKGWIMVVDSYNEGKTKNRDLASRAFSNITEVRSIIAQTYLELIRVWTVNNSGEWLFNRVESAGVQVETKFSRRCLKSRPKFLVKGDKAPESAALEAISGKKSYFKSEEKNDILARVAQHRSRGIDNWHFRKYEYILCLDRSVYETVMTLAKCCKKRYGDLPSYANLSKVILLKDLRLKDAAANLSADDTTRLVNSIKDGIKSFLDTEYHWKRPLLGIADGSFRTKQIVLSNFDIKLGSAEKEAALHEISTRTDCRIRVTDEKFDAQLLSITGRKEALSFASSLIKEAFIKGPH
ncbi:hypothetical protein IMSHALPRED_006834 [Imshaugia aleurites]|uniref:NACHT-NTPase and P-loop NTPases N-terminal domain-containing protein n=1 Tax=Imshaugia aleurites TaxID=172621 RepID=A0A8H3FJV4_9LECA|nr:hypothetical protein IMSHALPRED_006834 [Imshaugia aleurites]